MFDSDVPVTVSAVMPTYNTGAYLPAAIDSILAQDFQDWELIIVDDASTDDTPEVLSRYTDPRIRTYRRDTNGGRAIARNRAVTMARGRYIAIADSDDVSLPNRFSEQVAFLDAHPDVDVVSSQLLLFWGDAPPEVRGLFPEQPADIERRFRRGQMGIAHGASMLRASCFERCGLYSPDLEAAEDFELFLRMQQTCQFRTLPKPLLLYRHEHRVPLRKWMFRTRCHRYALYKASRQRNNGAADMPFQQFTDRWDVKTALLTVDLVRYVHYMVRAYVRPRHVLR
jgi:glycosyltransferase involved in cell wall biosynthesis